MKLKSVDSKCWELALHFISDIRGYTEDDVRRLAESLQDACEDACQDVEESLRRGVAPTTEKGAE